MNNKRIYLCLAHMSDAGLEQKYIKEAFDTNWVVPLGPNVDGFERDLEEFMNVEEPSPETSSQKRIVALSSGTAAVHAGLIDVGVRAGDEVICQSLTFCASVNPVVYLGARPVLVDSEPATWNLSPDLMEEAIKDRIRKTGRTPKAIVPVHLYGMPAEMDRIMEIAVRYDIPVMEDAAEAIGSKYKGQLCGTFGRYGVWSFNGNKMITTSGGGALICPCEESKKNAIYYATQAKLPTPYYQHEVIGFNYRLSNICAGIGRGQMKVLRDHIAHHRHVQALYEELLKDVKGITVHKQPDLNLNDKFNTPVYDSNYWLCTILLDEHLHVEGQENVYDEVEIRTDCEPNANVEAMRTFLDKRGIEARPLWKPMHKQPVYREAPAYVNGVSESLFKRGMCLPSGPCVTDEDVRYIVDCIKKAIC